MPDLVFSEMKFLQRDKDEPEAGSQLESLSRKRKKTQAHAKEEEISTYFTSVRPALTERNPNFQGKEKSRCLEQEPTNDPIRDRASEIGKVIHTTEVTEKVPYLGFGGRGASHESAGYVSWSESNRAPSAIAAHHPRRASHCNDQHRAGGDDQGPRQVDVVGEFQSRPTPPRVTRGFISSSAERFQTSSPQSTNKCFSRSQTFPHSKSSLRHITLIDPESRTSHRPTKNTALPSSKAHSVSRRYDHLPSARQNGHVVSVDGREVETPSVQHIGPAETRDTASHHRRERTEVEDIEEQTSSSIGQILRQCNTTFNNRHMLKEPSPYQVRDTYDIPVHGDSQFEAHRGHQASRVKFADIETPRHSRLPVPSGPSIYEQQQRRDEAVLYNDCEQYDTLLMPFAAEYEDIEEGINAVEEEWGVDVEDLDVQEHSAVPVTIEEGPCGRVPFDVGGNRVQCRRDTVAKPGFWRPNKLY